MFYCENLSIEEGKDGVSIQSSTTPYRRGIWKSDKTQGNITHERQEVSLSQQVKVNMDCRNEQVSIKGHT